MNRINLVSLGVRDMAKALTFYKNIGFQTYEEKENPPIVFFNNEGSKLALYPIQKLAEDINEKHPPAISQSHFSGITFACNMKSEQEVNEVMDLVIQAGGKVVKAPQKVFWGGYSGYFQDIDGYYWEVAYGDCWSFDSNNMLVIEKPE